MPQRECRGCPPPTVTYYLSRILYKYVQNTESVLAVTGGTPCRLTLKPDFDLAHLVRTRTAVAAVKRWVVLREVGRYEGLPSYWDRGEQGDCARVERRPRHGSDRLR